MLNATLLYIIYLNGCIFLGNRCSFAHLSQDDDMMMFDDVCETETTINIIYCFVFVIMQVHALDNYA